MIEKLMKKHGVEPTKEGLKQVITNINLYESMSNKRFQKNLKELKQIKSHLNNL